jgi:hypothetical protein
MNRFCREAVLSNFNVVMGWGGFALKTFIGHTGFPSKRFQDESGVQLERIVRIINSQRKL